MIRPILLLASMAAVPTLAPAQHKGTTELGAFGRYGVYPDLSLDNATGFGGRVGMFFSRKVSLEADVAFAQSTLGSLDINHTAFHVRLLGSLRLGKRVAFLIGGGWAHSSYSNDASETDDGVGWLVGLRVNLGQRLSLRIDGILNYSPSASTNGGEPSMDYALQAGVSLMIN